MVFIKAIKQAKKFFVVKFDYQTFIKFLVPF